MTTKNEELEEVKNSKGTFVTKTATLELRAGNQSHATKMCHLAVGSIDGATQPRVGPII